jgi:uncharacterized protein YaiI (UPF0178 family)
MRILIDADACPVTVKELLYKTSNRLEIEIIFVANQYMRIPVSDFMSSILVADGADIADDHIVEIMVAGDLVITADIPLADRVIKKNGVVLDPRGTFLTDENIGERLATRNLLDDLRTDGMITGGPKPYGNKEKQEFANQLNKFLTKVLK